MECRICGNTNLDLALDLGQQPWCNDFRLSTDPEAEKYPLRLVLCPVCELAQLDYTVKKEVMFTNHTYVSGTTKTLANHFFKLAKENKHQFNLQPDDFIVDIGGNDGTQLLQYAKLGFTNLLNVESASNIADIAVRRGVNTVCSFFNEGFVDKIQQANPTQDIKAKLINASGVFFHLEELHSVCRGITKLLDDEGVFVVQFMYLKDIIEHRAFDAIYHEHLCYYTLKSLQHLMWMHDMVLLDAYASEIHGGSMMAKFVKRNSLKVVSQRAMSWLQDEGHIDLTTLGVFAYDIEVMRGNVVKMLRDLKSQGKKIYGYGSPAKGTTFLTYCGIDTSIIDKLVEVNRLKVGLITPGTRIPIELESETDLPDYYFVLAWNFIDEIIAKNQHLLDKGVKFIVPLPEIKIYER